MAIMTVAECLLIACGTCGEQILRQHEPGLGLGRREPNLEDPKVKGFLDKNRACPDRALVAPSSGAVEHSGGVVRLVL